MAEIRGGVEAPQLSGCVQFYQENGCMLIVARISGLPKGSETGFFEEHIDDYMAREVLPHIPDAVAFFEENLGAKKPVIKTGAEITFTRCFYKYQQPTASDVLESKFMEIELAVSERVAQLFE